MSVEVVISAGWDPLNIVRTISHYGGMTLDSLAFIHALRFCFIIDTGLSGGTGHLPVACRAGLEYEPSASVGRYAAGRVAGVDRHWLAGRFDMGTGVRAGCDF